MPYSISDGEAFVKAARYSIELYLKSPHFSMEMVEKSLRQYSDRRGVFVTVSHYPTMTLRGCIGFPNPTGPLSSLLVEAAVAAATEDPRFVPVSHRELEDCVVEVSVLSQPVRIEEKSWIKRQAEIKLGHDGLIVQYGAKRGLLLPQVPIEERWNKKEFLDNACEKAGLPAGHWKRPEVDIFKFTAQVFREKSPMGEVEELREE